MTSAVSAREVRQRVALLGHHSYLYEALSARDNLMVAARFLGAPADRVEALLDRVGLAGRADDPVSAFSAGMRKRLSLARALLQDASVLLLDEPYGELDPPGFALLDRVLDEEASRDVTVLLATHLLDHGRERCDEAIVLEEGRLVWSGPAADLPAPGLGCEAPAGGAAQGLPAAVARARPGHRGVRVRRVGAAAVQLRGRPRGGHACASTPPGSCGWACCSPPP